MIEIRVSGNTCFQTNQEGKVEFSDEEHGVKFELNDEEAATFRLFYIVFHKYDGLSAVLKRVLES